MELGLKQGTNSSQIEDLGLALWKLHVKSDEQRLDEQLKFLQLLNKES